MSLFLFAALFASQPDSSSPLKPVFTSEDIVALSERAQTECGYASPQDLIALPNGERLKSLQCLIRVTVERSAALLPKTIEPGATIISTSSLEGLPVFVIQFS